MTGNKTYLGSIVLALVGVIAILVPDSSTWTAPSGQAKLFLGVGLLALAWLCFAIRHAIKTTKEHFDKLAATDRKALAETLANHNRAMTDRIEVLWGKMDAVHKDIDKGD